MSKGLKILIADDDRDMCELAEAGLSQRGYGVSWRLSPDEALAQLDVEDFAILLVDIHMEGMSGLDLCRAALAKRPDLVVVVMTGFGTLEHAIGAMRAGAYDFITKPVSMDALSLTFFERYNPSLAMLLPAPLRNPILRGLHAAGVGPYSERDFDELNTLLDFIEHDGNPRVSPSLVRG